MKRWRWMRVSTYRTQVAMTKAGEKMAMFYLFFYLSLVDEPTQGRRSRPWRSSLQVVVDHDGCQSG